MSDPNEDQVFLGIGSLQSSLRKYLVHLPKYRPTMMNLDLRARVEAHVLQLEESS